MPQFTPVDYQPDFGDNYSLVPVDHQPDFGDQPLPKQGQTIPPVNARPMTGQAAMSAAGIPDITKMTPGEQQMFALGAIPMLAGGPEAKLAQEAVPEAAQAVRQGIRAFHGSPYDFERFDLSKIGTGEGAQAYGHGLYFAENPAVAQDYKGKLSTLANVNDSTEARTALYYLQQNNFDKVATIADMENAFRQKLPNTHPLVQAVNNYNPGKTYEVNINADPEHFLDWDVGLPRQSQHVKDAIEAMGLREQMPNASGSQIYQRFASQQPSGLMSGIPQDMRATQKLKDAGIPGIKYLDQGSRAGNNPSAVGDAAQKVVEFYGGDRVEAAKQFERRISGFPSTKSTVNLDLRSDRPSDPQEVLRLLKSDEPLQKQTSNYVVFDDKLIDIRKKFGMAGLIAAGAKHFSTQQVDHQPDFEESQ